MHIHSDADAPACHLPSIEHRPLAGSATGTEPLRMVAIFSASPVDVTQVDGQALPLPWTS